jgi:hypothetical protein
MPTDKSNHFTSYNIRVYHVITNQIQSHSFKLNEWHFVMRIWIWMFE